MNRKYQHIFVLAIVAIFLVFANACKKPQPPKATILVIDQEGKPVKKAMVVIKAADSDSTHTMVYLESGAKPIADTSFTKANGKVEKTFLYEAIYRVEVTKEGNPIRKGIGVLVLENDKVYEETITITPQTTF